MSWINGVDNPQALTAVFSSLENLEVTELLELNARRDDQKMTIRVSLSRFPDKPSRRWDPEANRLQATLTCHIARIDHLSGWGFTNECTLQLTPNDDGGFAFRLQGASLLLHGSCALVRLDSLSAFQADVE